MGKHLRIHRIFAKCLVFMLIQTACAYRFTNSSRTLETGARSVAVEGIFDTTRHTFPKDILWREIQRAFASTGKIRLTSADEAEVLIRVHLTEAIFVPNPGQYNPNLKEPENPYTVSPVAPTSYPPLNRSDDSYSTGETVSYEFQVEAWKLGSGQQIFQKAYRHAFSYDLASRRDQRSVTTVSKENLEADLTSSAQSMARRVYLDILTKL